MCTDACIAKTGKWGNLEVCHLYSTSVEDSVRFLAMMHCVSVQVAAV